MKKEYQKAEVKVYEMEIEYNLCAPGSPIGVKSDEEAYSGESGKEDA